MKHEFSAWLRSGKSEKRNQKTFADCQLKIYYWKRERERVESKWAATQCLGFASYVVSREHHFVDSALLQLSSRKKKRKYKSGNISMHFMRFHSMHNEWEFFFELVTNVDVADITFFNIELDTKYYYWWLCLQTPSIFHPKSQNKAACTQCTSFSLFCAHARSL